MMRSIIIMLCLTYFHQIGSTRLGMIENIALVSSYSILSIQRPNCDACICDMFDNASNGSIGALNCWKNGSSNGRECQFFKLSNSSNITSNMFVINANSTFIFRPEFTWKSTAKTFSFSTGGLIIAGNGTAGSTSKQLDQPSCIYIDSMDDLYICDTNNNRIQKWSKNSTTGVTVAGGTQGNNASQLNQPLALTFDQFGFMYVVDSGNCRVQRFAPNSTIGVTVAGDSSGQCGSSTSLLDRPTGIAIDWNLNLFIADYSNRRIIEFSPNSTVGVSVTGRVSGKPYGVALKNRSSDLIYFTDYQKKEWNVWPNGASAATATIGSSTYFNAPTMITVDNDGKVFVVDETNEKVLMFSDISSTYEVLLDNPSPLQTTTGIAFDSQRNLYITSDTPAGVYKYPRL